MGCDMIGIKLYGFIIVFDSTVKITFTDGVIFICYKNGITCNLHATVPQARTGLGT